MGKMRLDKYLADMGLGTRSEVKKLFERRAGGSKLAVPSQNRSLRLTLIPMRSWLRGESDI